MYICKKMQNPELLRKKFVPYYSKFYLIEILNIQIIHFISKEAWLEITQTCTLTLITVLILNVLAKNH